MGSVVLIGAGAMGEALLAGLIASGQRPDDVLVVERRAERASELSERYGVEVVDAPGTLRPELVLLAVKPQDVPDAVGQLNDHLEGLPLVVSVVAGVSTGQLETLLVPGTPVLRVMPNTPALVGEGMAAVSPGSACTADDVRAAAQILESVGRVVEIPEHLQDAVTALSGSGPAYFFLVVEAMIDAGVRLGLPRPIATELAAQTAFGAAKMVRDSGVHPTLLREQVTSPGGTTAAGLAELEAHSIRAAFSSALEAARDRSRELGA